MNDNKNNKQTNYDVAEINSYGKRPQFSLEPNISNVNADKFSNIKQNNSNNTAKGSGQK